LINSETSFCAGAKDGKSGACVGKFFLHSFYRHYNDLSISGDSGGGLVHKINGKWTLIGIVSASLYDPATICDLENYALFTDVAKFNGWIDQVLLETD
jgi:secreted trypsin-like serine protease